jgi:large subunit ribosomal protein L29
MSQEELEEKLKELREELFNLRFQLATGQLKNVRRIKAVKTDIARAETILNEMKKRSA